jgi:hypothetical protein
VHRRKEVNEQQTMIPQQTFLRVRRRRNAGTALTLRLDGIGDFEEIEDGSSRPTSSSSNPPVAAMSRKRSAVWRRVSSDPEEAVTSSCRVVNAILSSSQDNEDEKHPVKKRRLTLVAEDSSDLSPVRKEGSKGLKVLNPLARMVDDSLQTVYVGSQTPRDHANFVWTDTRVSHQARQWLAWCNTEAGNLLHAAALWNDTELAADLLRMEIPGMIDATDAQGQTPYEVAQLAGHDAMVDVLQAFGADTTSFVYDMYCLEGRMEGCDDDDDDNEQLDAENTQVMSCMIENGIGYWNSEGELQLEAPSSASPQDAEARRLEEEGQEEDSNDEGWEGNDYPDEGHWGEDPDVIDDVYPDEVRAWQSYAVNDEEDGDYDYQFD